MGFWNRKYFILLLLYVFITTYFTAASMAYDFYCSVKWEIDTFYYKVGDHSHELLAQHAFVQLSFVLVTLIATLMTFFFKFHIKLL